MAARHPNSLANLTPWPKGVSGNPGGRRKNFSDRMVDVMGKEFEAELAKVIGALALAGDKDMLKLCAERSWPCLSRQELTGAEGKPIELEHAESAIAELPTDVLRELDALAERVNAQRGNGAATNGDGIEH